MGVSLTWPLHYSQSGYWVSQSDLRISCTGPGVRPLTLASPIHDSNAGVKYPDPRSYQYMKDYNYILMVYKG